MLDRHTFGKTPAAIYLADHLNFLNDSKYTRKTSLRIHAVQTIINDAVTAHEAGHLNIKVLNFVCHSMREKVMKAAERLLKEDPYVGSGGHPMPDVLSINLMTNILIGGIKSVINRSMQVKNLKKRQRSIVDKINDSPYPIDKEGQVFMSSDGLSLVSTKKF